MYDFFGSKSLRGLLPLLAHWNFVARETESVWGTWRLWKRLHFESAHILVSTKKRAPMVYAFLVKD